MTERACPDHGKLVAFNEGRLPPVQAEAISTHLSGCRRCEADLRQVDEGGDSIARLLRTVRRDGLANPFGYQPEYSRMEAAAKRAGQAATPPDPVGDTLSPPVAVPTRLDVYELGAPIGRGGMGTVYRAFHTRLKKWVALKVVRTDRAGEPRAEARFRREMEAVGRLDHPNIVRATDAGEDGGVHFLVMDLIEGLNLAELLRRCGPLPPADACELVRQAAAGLQYAHTRGLVHRDIKPSNLLLSAQGQLKVLDLGLARLAGDRPASDDLTGSRDIMGTADFMAPEQWEAGHTVDIRADLYSLGCTLYALLTGRPPFGGPEYDSPFKKMAAHLRTTPRPVRQLRPKVPDGVADVLARLLAKDPARRYPAPGEVALALAPFAAGADLEGRATQFPRPDSAGAPDLSEGQVPTQRYRDTAPAAPPKGGKRRRLLAAVLAIPLAIGLGIALLGDPHSDLGGEVTGRLQPGVWHDLLESPPTVLLWPKKGDHSQWNHYPAKRQLWVNCAGRGMLKLADVHGAEFDLEVTIFQNPWVGGVGVFYRDRREGTGRNAHRCADILFLQHFDDWEPPESARLTRGLMKRFFAPPSAHPDLLDSTLIPRPVVGEHRLRVTVGPGGLKKVLWDSRPVAPSLCRPVRGVLPRRGAEGSVGVFVQDSGALFRSARLYIHATPGEER